MNKQRRTWLILLLAVGLLLAATPVLADGDPPDDNGVVIWNEDYTLEEGKWVEGDLIVFNGDVTLEDGSRVEGSVIVWNGSADVAGTVEGDLVVSSGDITLDDSARVEGAVVCSWNCDVSQKEGAQVDGGIIEGAPWRGFRLPIPVPVPVPSEVPTIPEAPSPFNFWVSGPGQVLEWAFKIMRTAIAVLVVAAVAGLVALIWPDPISQVGRVAVEAPGTSFGVGLLTMVAATVLAVALAITICLSPVAILATLALGAAGLFGWIGIGAVVGKRLLQTLNARETAPLWAAGLGTLLITLIGTGLSIALCLAPIGWLMMFVLGCLGLGAVVLTRFGTTAYVPATGSGPRPPHPASPSPPPVPAAAPEPAEAPPEEPAAEEPSTLVEEANDDELPEAEADTAIPMARRP